MQQHSLDQAITTADLLHDFASAGDHAEDPKCSIRDLFFSAGQVGTALSLCWMVHCFV